ncbi:MAG: 16S rRNA (adenine(1518)-N(6)/adenine(1519)-N(6))-dimethyltransferase RsmA [Campylobacterota bacterium]
MNLKEYANKAFGQNFLKDETYVERIIQSMPDKTDRVVEIGPGLGDLTKKLIEVKDVTAYEVDSRSCRYLQQTFKPQLANKRLQLIEGDVLEHWQGNLYASEYDLVANLPYYIATAIILKALEDENCRSILVMVQKEVALRFAAHTGEKAFCALSVLTQSAGSGQIMFDVPPQAFEPPPKVTSSILLIDKTVSLKDKQFDAFLKVCFKQPRKTLLKNLSATYDKELLQRLFEKFELQATIRPHQVETPLYHHLYDRLKGEENGKQNTKSKSRTKQSKQSKYSS